MRTVHEPQLGDRNLELICECHVHLFGKILCLHDPIRCSGKVTIMSIFTLLVFVQAVVADSEN